MRPAIGSGRVVDAAGTLGAGAGATTGGGAVKVTVTGDQRCQAVEIDPEILQDADVDMLQDLILTAFNTALDKSREMAAERLGPLSSGLPF